jgi:glycosyltransferase involved in cell wall biosynthesis
MQFLPVSQTFVIDLINELGEQDCLEQAILTHEVIADNIDKVPVFDISLNYLSKHVKKLVNAKNKLICGLAHNTDYVKANSIITRFKPDVIHCHFGTAAYMNFYIQKFCKVEIPLVISLHGYDVFDVDKLFSGYRNSIEKLAQRNVVFTCPSKYLEQEIHKRLSISADKVKVVPNGFNAGLFKPASKSRKLNEKCNIVHTGRFVDWKGQKFLIEAVSTLKKRGYDQVELVLVGGGETLHENKKLAKTLGVEKSILFKGAVSHQTVAQLLNDADLYVHPSYTSSKGNAETFGVAILEALACSLPVVITDSGGMKEIISSPNENYVKVVPEKSSEVLADAIQCFIDDNASFDEAQFAKFRQQVVDDCNIKLTKDKIYSIYETLVKG